jgi:hypothetical protein
MSAYDLERTSGLSIRSTGYTGNAGRNNIGAAPLADRSAKLQLAHPFNMRTRMAAPEEINADMLAFWNGKGGHTWVARQEHTDITSAEKFGPSGEGQPYPKMSVAWLRLAELRRTAKLNRQLATRAMQLSHS